MNNLRYDVIMLAIFYLSVIIFLSACAPVPAISTDECKDFRVKTILPSDTKQVQYEKLEYNTKMRGLCTDHRF